jgi:hypothetical protein
LHRSDPESHATLAVTSTPRLTAQQYHFNYLYHHLTWEVDGLEVFVPAALASRVAQASLNWLPTPSIDWLPDPRPGQLLDMQLKLEGLTRVLLPLYLRHLEPPRVALAALQLRCSELSLPAHSSLARLTHLRHLELRVCDPKWSRPWPTAATLAALTSLTSLRLDLGFEDRGLHGPPDICCLQQLTRLIELRRLDICLSGRCPSFLTFPAPAGFPRLQRYSFLSSELFQARRGLFRSFGWLAAAGAVDRGLPPVPQVNDGEVEVAAPQCTYPFSGGYACSFADGVLRMRNLYIPGRDLAQLLAKLLPPAALPLKRLSFGWHHQHVSQRCGPCTALSDLTELEVAYTELPDVCDEQLAKQWGVGSFKAAEFSTSMRRLVADMRRRAPGLRRVETPNMDSLGRQMTAELQAPTKCGSAAPSAAKDTKRSSARILRRAVAGALLLLAAILEQ